MVLKILISWVEVKQVPIYVEGRWGSLAEKLCLFDLIPPCLTFIAYRRVEQLLQPVDKGRVGGAHRSGQVHPTANGGDRDLIA